MSGQFSEYLYDVTMECPYGLRHKATYRQAHFNFLADDTMAFFLENGYRRNGNYLYTMVCDGCSACIPIRLLPEKFIANRNQKRVWRRNQDIEVKINPLRITNEKLAICDKFLQTRFPGKGNSAIDYYAGFFVNNLERTFDVEFWCEERLLGVSIIDVFPDSINCVYFYFDPDEEKRSPGTFNILYLLDFALQKNFKHIYLGYFIEEIGSMNYKARFKPHYLLKEGIWREVI